jgi:hypothetical protein
MIDGCNLFFIKMFKVVSVRRQESWDRWTWKHWPRSCKRARALWLQYLEQLKDQEAAKGLVLIYISTGLLISCFYV